MKKPLLFGALCLSLARAWGQAPPPPSSQAASPTVAFTIEGQVRQPATGWAYLLNPSGSLDSAAVQNGRFRLVGKTPMVAMTTLFTTPTAGFNAQFRRRPILTQLGLWVERGTVQVVSPDSLTNATATGTPLNNDYERLRAALKPINARQEQAAARHFAAPAARPTPAAQAAWQQQAAAFETERQQVFAQFIRVNPGSPVSAQVLSWYAGGGPDLDLATAGPLFESLTPAVRQSPPGQQFAARLADARRFGIGQPAPDFTQNDPAGKPVALRDFRGKYVLLDFWASWCKPCREENPNVVAAYNQFKARNFTVLSVSLDKGRDAWLKAIAADGLPWTHVSDLKFWDNQVARLYDIQGVPQNLLIGPDGRILARNLRGPALGQKLAAVLPAR